VLFQHGLSMTAENWFTSESGKPVVMQALDDGWDVWLGNNRGTRYSQGHDKYDIIKDADKYWAFDWAEMGKYDVPAFIDKILENTPDYKKVTYVGFSQGTTQMFYGLAHKNDYFRKKLEIFVALAPCTKLTHST